MNEDLKVCGIYSIFDALTGECLYVGQSKNIHERRQSHFKRLRGERHLNHLRNGLSVLEKMSPDWISGFFVDVSIMTTSRTNLRSSGSMNFTQDSTVLFRLSTTGGLIQKRPGRRLLEGRVSLSDLESILHV